MNEDLEARAEEAAENAECQRCRTRILGEQSALGMVFGRLMVPALGVQQAYQLCGKCGLALREFLFPELLQDPAYQESKSDLLREFWT